jgi:hypothetical protein
MKTNIDIKSRDSQFFFEMRNVSECGKVWKNQTGHKFNFTSSDVFHNYHKIYTFLQYIYNLLQSIHRLHVSALLGHHQALHMNRFL